MSIQVSLSSDGMEELYSPPTLKEMCLYKCLTHEDVLTKQVKVNSSTQETLAWEKYRLKEPIPRDLVKALLDAREKYLFMLTPKVETVLAAIRMSQPNHLVKLHLSNTFNLDDPQLEFLISGGNVKYLDINGCYSLRRGTLNAINRFGSNLLYLRIGTSSCNVLPRPEEFTENLPILQTPNLKTFIISDIHSETSKMTNYWRCLLQDFICNLEVLRISGVSMFRTLDFLEQAKDKLTSLSMRNCMVTMEANAFETLYKLDKLRVLDLYGFWTGWWDPNVVQRLLTAMPELTSLAVDPYLAEDMHVNTPIQGRAPGAKKLKFFGIVRNDEAEIGKAQLFAKDVAHLGTVEGELRALEYYSKEVNSDCYYLYDILDMLLKSQSLIVMAETAPRKTVTVISLLIKTIKKNGVDSVPPECLEVLKKLLTKDIDVVPKLGEVLKTQCIGAISAWTELMIKTNDEPVPECITNVIDIFISLDGELCFDNYMAVVPNVMCLVALAMTTSAFENYPMDARKDLVRKTAQLLGRAVDRFRGKTNELWGISWVLLIIQELKRMAQVSQEADRIDLVDIFTSFILSLKKLCLNNGPRREMIRQEGGARIVSELLESIDGCSD